MSAIDARSARDRQLARITLAAERHYLAAVLAFLREAAGRLGLVTTDVSGLERAVEAVCLNVIEHAFEPGQGASFDVALLRRPGHVVVSVEDRGLPFDFARLEAEPDSDLAIPSLRGLAEGIRFLNLGTAGNRVEILKRLPYSAIDAYPEEDVAPAGTTAPAAPLAPVTVRMMTPEDAVGVARCTYAVYGYTVPDEYLYFPDRIREMLHGGLLEVVVAATSDGDIVACLTSEVAHPGAAVGYLGEGHVIPAYRHHGLLEDMLRFIQRRATDRGMLGLYGEAVTVHPYSQKSNIALGFTVVGVQLADEGATVVFKAISETTSAKRTATVLYFYKTNEGPRRTVYPPPQHRAMIERIYAEGRFDRQIATIPAKAPPEPGAARVTVDVFPEWSEAVLHVTAYGPDLPALVRARLRELCRRRIEWICLDLPLSHPAAAEVCAPIEALGFFFCGVIPNFADDDDVLRLQYLNEIEADVESAQLASPFGKEMFDYVVRAMNAAIGGA
jgi:serine/threonine-protein kinase RsbW